MTAVELKQKYRLRYVRETYFPEFAAVYPLRRILGEHTEAEIARISQIPELKLEKTRGGSTRTLASWIALPGERDYSEGRKPENWFIESFAEVLAREHVVRKGLKEDPRVLRDSLIDYFRHGKSTPFELLEHSGFPALELTFEHLSEAIPRNRPSGRRSLQDLAEEGSRLKALTFLQGAPPMDWDVLAQVAIERPAEVELRSQIRAGTRFIVLTGAAGDGKTTILKRIAMDLRRDGRRVLFMDSPPRNEAFPKIPPVTHPTILFVDNAHNAAGFPTLEQCIAGNDQIQVVLCAREYLWLRRDHDFSVVRPYEVALPRIEFQEAEGLAAQIVAFDAAHHKTTAEDLTQAIMTSVHGDRPHLLAAMISATHGRQFIKVIDDIIANFQKAGEGWVLRAVACGYLVETLTSGQIGLLPHYLIVQLIADHSEARGETPLRAAQRAVERIRDLGSEIIPIGYGAARGGTVYDLRHPDIAERVLEKSYGLILGTTVGNPTMLEDDLAMIVNADLQSARTARGNALRMRYAVPVAETLIVDASVDHDWFPPEIARELMKGALRGLGHWENEKQRKAAILRRWAEAEQQRMGRGLMPPAGTPSLPDTLFQEAATTVPDMKGIWLEWANTAARLGRVGGADTPYSTGWIFHRSWEADIRDWDLSAAWARNEIALGNIGEFDQPQAFSARSIFRETWSCLKDGHLGEAFFGAWATLELEQGEVGQPGATDCFSAVGVCRTAWDAGMRRASMVALWAGIERDRGNSGDFDDPAPYSARWIWRQGAEAGISAPINYDNAWAMFEFRQGHVGAWSVTSGSEASAEPYTARWIFQRAFALNPPDSPSLWGTLEAYVGNEGDIAAPLPRTARRIFRDSWRKKPEYWLLRNWAYCEWMLENLGSIENPDLYSARWILQNFKLLDSPFWPNFMSGLGIWVEYTSPLGHLGKLDSTSPYSARYYASILRNADLSLEMRHECFQQLAAFEHRRGAIDLKDDVEFGPRWYYDAVRESLPASVSSLESWIAPILAFLDHDDGMTVGRRYVDRMLRKKPAVSEWNDSVDDAN